MSMLAKQWLVVLGIVVGSFIIGLALKQIGFNAAPGPECENSQYSPC